MQLLLAIVLANDFWLSAIFAFVPVMCMRALVKNQLACFKDEGWNLLKALEKMRCGYTAALELNWVPNTTRGLALSLSISALWSLVLLTWAVYQINQSSAINGGVQTTGQIVSVNSIISTNHKLPYVCIDSVQYRYQMGATIYSGTTLADRHHFKGQSVFVMYDRQNPSRSSLAEMPSLITDAAYTALPMAIVTVLCLIYTLCNWRLLRKLRGDWNEDAPLKLD